METRDGKCSTNRMKHADMRHGDHFNIVCPHCGIMLNYVCMGAEVPHGKIVRFTKECNKCGGKIELKAEWSLDVTATGL